LELIGRQPIALVAARAKALIVRLVKKMMHMLAEILQTSRSVARFGFSARSRRSVFDSIPRVDWDQRRNNRGGEPKPR
jgi:hypothetical protein